MAWEGKLGLVTGGGGAVVGAWGMAEGEEVGGKG